MRGAIQFALIDLRVRNHVRRVEHAELNARRVQADDRRVDVALFQEAFLHGIDVWLVIMVVLDLEGEVDAFVVHAALQADGGRLRLRRLEVVVLVDIDDRAAIGDDITFEVPLAAELVLKQEFVGACGLAVDAVVGAHDGGGLGLCDGGAEGGQIGVDLVVLAYGHVGGVARRLGAAVHGVVFGRRDDAVISGVFTLHPGDEGHAHAPGEERVFAVGLLAAAPTRIAKDVDVRSPEVEALEDIA